MASKEHWSWKQTLVAILGLYAGVTILAIVMSKEPLGWEMAFEITIGVGVWFFAICIGLLVVVFVFGFFAKSLFTDERGDSILD